MTRDAGGGAGGAAQDRHGARLPPARLPGRDRRPLEGEPGGLLLF